jgi:hypothetical protein
MKNLTTVKTDTAQSESQSLCFTHVASGFRSESLLKSTGLLYLAAVIFMTDKFGYWTILSNEYLRNPPCPSYLPNSGFFWQMTLWRLSTLSYEANIEL